MARVQKSKLTAVFDWVVFELIAIILIITTVADSWVVFELIAIILIIPTVVDAWVMLI